MFEGKQAEYKRELAESVSSHLAGAEPRELAVAQAGVGPWRAVVPIALGSVLIVASLVNQALPAWAGIVGVLIAFLGAAYMTLIPRRMLVRTDEGLLVFAMTRNQKEAVGDPLLTLEVAELPVDPSSQPMVLGGERLWANYGSGIERTAMRNALAAPGSVGSADPS